MWICPKCNEKIDDDAIINCWNCLYDKMPDAKSEIPTDVRNVNEVEGENVVYAGFWRRFGSYWLDFIFISPLTIAGYYAGEYSKDFATYWAVPGLLIGIFYHVYLVYKFGGTPGKLVLGIKIKMFDGSPISLKAAAIRHSVLFILTTLSTMAIIVAINRMSDSDYYSLGYLDRSRKIMQLVPAWYSFVNVIMQIWIWSEFIVMLTNKKRMAVHDFMANTVVVVRNK